MEQNSKPVIMGVEEVMHALIIRMLNSEMEQRGYTTIKGKVSRKYFYERFHCGDAAPRQEAR